jgi:hypothetical protein
MKAYRAQSSRLAGFGGRGMSFNICRGALGSLAIFTAIRPRRDSRPNRPRLRVRYPSHSCRAHQQPARQLMTTHPDQNAEHVDYS